MFFGVWRAYFTLIQFERPLVRKNFAVIYDRVRRHPRRNVARMNGVVEEVSSAVDLAWTGEELSRSCALRLLKVFPYSSHSLTTTRK